jgi:hypothetical protein
MPGTLSQSDRPWGVRGRAGRRGIEMPNARKRKGLEEQNAKLKKPVAGSMLEASALGKCPCRRDPGHPEKGRRAATEYPSAEGRH